MSHYSSAYAGDQVWNVTLAVAAPLYDLAKNDFSKDIALACREIVGIEQFESVIYRVQSPPYATDWIEAILRLFERPATGGVRATHRPNDRHLGQLQRDANLLTAAATAAAAPITPSSVNHDRCSRWATVTVFVRWSSGLAKSDELDYPLYASAERLLRTGNPQYSIWPYSVVSGRCHGLQNR